MLALFQISETDDLGMALGRLFLPGSPQRERLAGGRCFARYAVIEDASPAPCRLCRIATLAVIVKPQASTELGTEN